MNDDRTQRWDSPAANHYDRYRPGPAEAAVRWLVPSHCQLAVDVGAGTGGLTRLLLIQGIRVVAVEPDGHMLRVLADACPAAAAVQGTGEVLPVKTAAADAVVVSSAWHWMRPEAATREAERVLQPGGIFGIVYNSRDKTVPWVADIEQFLRKLPLVARREAAGPARDPDNDSPVARERSDQLLKPGLSGTFTQPRTTCISWAKPMTPAEIAGFFTSYYGILSLPRHLRHQLAVQLNMYISEHPRLSGRENVDFPMISTCWQVRRVADGLSPLQVPSGERLPASLPPYAGVPSPIAIPGRQRP